MLKVSEILEATGGRLIKGNPDTVVNSVSTDTRTIKSGDLFIPLIGDNFNGHDYIGKALEGGAIGYLVKEYIDEDSDCFAIEVNDTLKALQDIAQFHRKKLDIPLIAVTGSCGKTTTKEMIYQVLAKKYNVLKTEGNKNNHIGLPQTLLRLTEKHDIAVAEMGMSGLGEISLLSKIAKPDFAVITNIGLSHIGMLGSIENILKAKAEIFDGLKSNGMAIINGDDRMLQIIKEKKGLRNIFFGLDKENDFTAYNVKSINGERTSFGMSIDGREFIFELPMPGIYNVYNAMPAIVLGLHFKVEPELIMQALKGFVSEKMRMNINNLSNGIRVINDAYNASPHSMQEALKVMAQISGKRKIAILGDMLELGDFAQTEHEQVGKGVAENGIDVLVTLGDMGRFIAKGALQEGMPEQNVKSFYRVEQIKEFLSENLSEGNIILVKGSRGMKMEKVVDYLLEVEQECK